MIILIICPILYLEGQFLTQQYFKNYLKQENEKQNQESVMKNVRIASTKNHKTLPQNLSSKVVINNPKKLPFLESKKFFYVNQKPQKVIEKNEKNGHLKFEKIDFSGETNKLSKHMTIDAIPTAKARNVKTLSDFFYSQQNSHHFKSNNDNLKARLTQYEISKLIHTDRIKKN